MNRHWKWILCAALAGCGGAAPLDNNVDETAIQGGAVDANDPAVGLVWLSGGGFCSGVLIAPDVVLTAGHCAIEPIEAFYTGEGKRATTVGVEPESGLKKHDVADQAPYPGYDINAGCPNPTIDVGLVRLAKPLTSVKPLALAAAPPKKGAVCRVVGYGIHDDAKGNETFEQKRRADVSVVQLDAAAVLVDWKTGISDHGDSGGPLLCGGKIVGDTSCGTDGSFPDHERTWYARTDAAAKWIASTVAAWK